MKSIRLLMRIPVVVVAVGLGALLAPAGCASHSDELLGVERARDASLQFNADAGTGACEDDAGCTDAALVEYCPSTRCPFPYTTCRYSKFSCEVDLGSDARNCGGCGQECPSNRARAEFSCVEGRCAMSCKQGFVDCNGLLDDDCEVKLGTNENCSACGDRCTDPDKPCIVDRGSQKAKCGCDAGLTHCEEGCVDTQNADDHCGACDVVCDPSGGGKPAPPPHMHYGCGGGTCDKLKCDSYYANCDGDLENGCEVYLLSLSTCGSCSTACDANQRCELDREGHPVCMCPKGKTRCGTLCVDLNTEPRHCGGCDYDCTHIHRVRDNSYALCTYGTCGSTCLAGYADCNDDVEDGCETLVRADPENCGACGNKCAAGQACAGGQCVVEPCSSIPEEAVAQ